MGQARIGGRRKGDTLKMNLQKKKKESSYWIIQEGFMRIR